MKISNFINKLRGLSETKKKIIIGVIVVFFALIMGFFWFMSTAKYISKFGESVNSIDLPKIEFPNLDFPDNNQPDNADEATEIADWKTYTNSEYGFEMKYPQDWDARDYNRDDISFIKPDPLESSRIGFSLDLAIEPNPKELSAKDFVQEFLKNQKNDEPKISYQDSYELTVANLPGYELNGVFGQDRLLEYIYISKGDHILRFAFPLAEKNSNFTVDPVTYNKICHDILSTFKFTDLNISN